MFDLSNQYFCKMGELSDDGMFIYNTKTNKFLYLNDGLAMLWDVAKEDVFLQPSIMLDAIHIEDQNHALLSYQKFVDNPLPSKYEVRILTPEEKYICISIFPCEDQLTLLICGMVEDISVPKRNKIHIEQINAHKNVTLEVLAHDLKEPLGMMRLSASSMEDEVAKTGSDSMKLSLSFIKEMCERNLRLVRSMINREFVKSSVVELKKDRIELVWMLEDLLRFYRRSHLREVKSFHFNSAQEKVYISLDAMKFLQVINNLISNAIKFTPNDGVINLEVIEEAESVLITVADNGIGIPQTLHATLFDRDTKELKLGLTGKNSGGLGMNIIKTIVELHDGIIWFESEVGKGSKFYIKLPK